MTQIAHSFSEQTTRQVVTGTTPTTVLSHASGNFVAGQKYLIVVTALVDLAVGATNDIVAQVVHGVTLFDGSHMSLEPTNAAKRYNYAWFTVWTAVASEAVDFQIACSAAADVGADQITIFAMRLDADLTENVDWFFNELATDGALSTTPLDGASITFTPLVSTNWLVLTTAQLDVVSLTVNYASRIFPASGTYSDAGPIWSREGEDANNTLVATLGRVFEDLGAVSQTFKEQSFNEVGNSGNRLHSAIFALNLNKFRQKVHFFDDSDEPLGTILWDDLLGSVSIVPDKVTDIWSLATCIFVPTADGNEITHRIQVDAVDQPDTQTADAYQEEEPADGLIDKLAIWRQTMEAAVSIGVHTVTWEAESSGSAGDPLTRNRCMVVITMELAGDLPTVAKIPYEALGLVQVTGVLKYETIKDPFTGHVPTQVEILPFSIDDHRD